MRANLLGVKLTDEGCFSYNLVISESEKQAEFCEKTKEEVLIKIKESGVQTVTVECDFFTSEVTEFITCLVRHHKVILITVGELPEYVKVLLKYNHKNIRIITVVCYPKNNTQIELLRERDSIHLYVTEYEEKIMFRGISDQIRRIREQNENVTIAFLSDLLIKGSFSPFLEELLRKEKLKNVKCFYMNMLPKNFMKF